VRFLPKYKLGFLFIVLGISGTIAPPRPNPLMNGPDGFSAWGGRSNLVGEGGPPLNFDIILKDGRLSICSFVESSESQKETGTKGQRKQ
jgi:hypothetical protein